MLADLIRQYGHTGKLARNDKSGSSGNRIERDFSEAGCVLFLTRVISWLKVTYQFGFAVKEQLKVIQLFLDCGRKYVAKFVAVGGVNTLLDILRCRSVPLEDKLMVLRVLHSLQHISLLHKELLCRFGTIDSVFELMARTDRQGALEEIQDFVITLGTDNPMFQADVLEFCYDTMISGEAHAQQAALFCAQQLVLNATGLLEACEDM
jgi:hypothetical protein